MLKAHAHTQHTHTGYLLLNSNSVLWLLIHSFNSAHSHNTLPILIIFTMLQL